MALLRPAVALHHLPERPLGTSALETEMFETLGSATCTPSVEVETPVGLDPFNNILSEILYFGFIFHGLSMESFNPIESGHQIRHSTDSVINVLFYFESTELV